MMKRFEAPTYDYKHNTQEFIINCIDQALKITNPPEDYTAVLVVLPPSWYAKRDDIVAYIKNSAKDGNLKITSVKVGEALDVYMICGFIEERDGYVMVNNRTILLGNYYV